MKRYVRTEDGHIIDTQNTKPFMIVGCYIDFNLFGRFKITNASDSIEELVDCFVDYCEEDDSHLVTTADKPIRRHNHEIYGAVWADEGLIYVAKMNEKGTLELL